MSGDSRYSRIMLALYAVGAVVVIIVGGIVAFVKSLVGWIWSIAIAATNRVKPTRRNFRQ